MPREREREKESPSKHEPRIQCMHVQTHIRELLRWGKLILSYLDNCGRGKLWENTIHSVFDTGKGAHTQRITITTNAKFLACLLHGGLGLLSVCCGVHVCVRASISSCAHVRLWWGSPWIAHKNTISAMTCFSFSPCIHFLPCFPFPNHTTHHLLLFVCSFFLEFVYTCQLLSVLPIKLHRLFCICVPPICVCMYVLKWNFPIFPSFISRFSSLNWEYISSIVNWMMKILALFWSNRSMHLKVYN